MLDDISAVSHTQAHPHMDQVANKFTGKDLGQGELGDAQNVQGRSFSETARCAAFPLQQAVALP